jgi:hypothetical protein
MLPMKRRSFLQASAAAGATLWLPRRARGELRGALRRAVVLYLPGGVRWEASFHAAESQVRNPYGRLPLSLVPEGQRAHQRTPGRPWPVSRIFHQRLRAADADRLCSEDAADYCFAQPRLSRWPGQPALPSFISLAPQIGVLSCDADPGGPTVPALLTHMPAQRRLFTGSPAGERGLATLVTAALRGRTRLPAVVVDAPGFAMGAGGEAQPLSWYSVLGPPPIDALRQLGPDGAREAAEALAVDTAPPETAYGATVDGAPLTHAMLRQLFGTTEEDAVAGDPLRELLGPSSGGDDAFGWQGARAVRLLQLGAPFVCLSAGDFDTHCGERTAGAAQMVRVGRLLAGLAFALRHVADPDTGAPLWDSTLVMVVSEFGRRGPNLLPDGFNPTGGSDHAREQHVPMMGGPLLLPGQVIDDGGRPYHANRVWTSLLSAMGLEVDIDMDEPGLRRRDFPEIPGLLVG